MWVESEVWKTLSLSPSGSSTSSSAERVHSRDARGENGHFFGSVSSAAKAASENPEEGTAADASMNLLSHSISTISNMVAGSLTKGAAEGGHKLPVQASSQPANAKVETLKKGTAPGGNLSLRSASQPAIAEVKIVKKTAAKGRKALSVHSASQLTHVEVGSSKKDTVPGGNAHPPLQSGSKSPDTKVDSLKMDTSLGGSKASLQSSSQMPDFQVDSLKDTSPGGSKLPPQQGSQ